MPHRPTSFLKARVLLIAAGCLSLAACQGYYGPHPVPEGYVNHGKLYKSPEAAKPRSIGYPYTEQHNAESAAHWRMAAGDLVSRITARNGVPPMPVYVEPASPHTAFNASFDNFLREALLKQGFRISAAADGGPVVRYSATIVEHKGARENEVSAEAMQAPASGPVLPGTDTEVVLGVTVTAGQEVLADESGVYYIPEADKYQYDAPIIEMLPIVGER